ncbi:UHRF1BP1L [Cordylochernes scorpioides]|uniref:UHRF1BP1L n=1 Tax=Cordylochernes scorpioides TaxID=51811 RepID=A0ABY6LCJ9_9ARAC|nr:UHRF1BP1L [Cordylochernes scorpioides]
MSVFQLSRLTVESRTPSWKQGELRLCRIKDTERGEILLFKQVDWQVVRIEAKARTPDSNLTPLRLITNQACCRLTIKKRLKDCSLVDWKVMVVLDDLLWVLTDSQLLAAVHFSSTLSELIRRSTEQAHKVKAKHKLEVSVQQQQNEARQQNKPVPPTQQHKAQGSVPLSSISRFFNHYNIHETSYHILCHRIDLHLCDELNPTDGVKQESPSNPEEEVQSSRRTSLLQKRLKYLMSSCIVIRLDEYQAFKVSTAQSCRRGPAGAKQDRFLSSDLHSISLPPETKALHLELTSYYYPGEMSCPGRWLMCPGPVDMALVAAPPPNLYAYLGPLVLTYDITTILWLNTFFMNLQNSLVSHGLAAQVNTSLTQS